MPHLMLKDNMGNIYPLYQRFTQVI